MWLAMGNEFAHFRDDNGFHASRWRLLHQVEADSPEALYEDMAKIDVVFARDLHKTRLRHDYSNYSSDYQVGYINVVWFFVGFVPGLYEDTQDVTGPWISDDENVSIYKPENTKVWQEYQVSIAQEQQQIEAKRQAEREKQAQERAKQDRVEYERLKKLFAPE